MHSSSRSLSFTALLALSALSALPLGCSSGGPGPYSQASQSISDGVNDDTHTNVVGIAIHTSRGGGICSGSLIAPNLVLTARHCVSPVPGEALICSRVTFGGMTYQPTLAQAPYPASAFAVTVQGQVSPFSPFVRVAEVITPDGVTGNPLCGHDIALLRLETPITSVTPIKPRLDIAPEAHETFTASGYGATDGAGHGAGRRRMRDALTIEFVGFAQAVGGVTILEESEWIGNEGTCQGDSGGPALDELGEIIGIVSRGEANSCVRPVYTRVDSFAEFIRAQATRAAMLGGLTPPAWVTPPTPRAGGQGDGCDSQTQCAPTFVCEPTGHGRECTADRCSACPSGWICTSDEVADHCVRDPSVPLPPPTSTDAGTPPGTASTDAAVNTAGDAATDTDAGHATDTNTPPVMAVESGGCSAAPTRSSGLLPVLFLSALALAFERRRARR